MVRQPQILRRFQLLLMIAVLSSVAQAGSVLHLQAGDLNLADIKGLNSPLQNFTLAETANPQFFLLQFHQPLSLAEQKQLADHQVEVVRYIPDDAYVVRANQKTLANLQNQNPNVNGFAVFRGSIKLNPNLPRLSVFNKNEVSLFQVHVLQASVMAGVTARAKSLGAIVVESVGNVLVIKASRQIVPQLSQLDGVEWITAKPHMEVFDFRVQQAQPTIVQGDITALTGYETGTKLMGFNAAYAVGLQGQDQLVAVADTGLDTGDAATLADDFKPGFSQAVALGMASESWADSSGHGTHVTGSVLSRGSLSQGVIHGGANGARLYFQGMWSETYSSLTVPSDISILFEPAYQAGARVHSDSWGDPKSAGVYSAEASDIDKYIWNHPDMLILIASGNEGVDLDKDGRVDAGSVSSPSTAKNVISVGASQNLVLTGGVQSRAGDVCTSEGKCRWPSEPLASSTFSSNPEGLLPFSSRGPTQDGRIKPDIVAPGSNILSNCSHVAGASELWGRFNADYCYSGGTSMSTPLTAGAVAVLRQYLQKTIDAPSAALVKAVLLHTAHDMYPGQFGEVGKGKGQEILTHAPNIDEGFGRVDLAMAISTKMQMVDDKVGVATNEKKSFDASSDIRRVTLVYSDFPGSPTATKALVNSLDIEVHVGDQIFRSESHIDNAKQVSIPANLAGKVSVTVVGTNVPMGKAGHQPFALVFSSLQ